MPEKSATNRFLFPRWLNYLLPVAAIVVVGSGFYVPVLFALGASPKTLAVGYAPTQPVPYSHAVHVGKLGLDCRYCHSTVEKTAFASLPPTATCMNCHTNIRANDPNLKPVLDSWNTGKPIEWVKVHDLPDYVYFDHRAHVNHGVGCSDCHGRIDHMDVVTQEKPLSMAWCLDCHRDPAANVRPNSQITNMDYKHPDNQADLGKALVEQYKIHDITYMTSCSTCHH